MFSPMAASAAKRLAPDPRATRTAPSRGIAVPPPVEICVTMPTRSVAGAVGGNGWSTTSTVPEARGVAAPHTGVKSDTPWAPGRWFRPFSALSGAGALPLAEHRHPAHEQASVVGDAEAGALRMRGRLEHPRLHEHPGREPLVPGPEVAVHTGDVGARRGAPLHGRDRLATEQRVVGEERPKRVQAAGLRRAKDVDDHRAVKGELDLTLVRHARHQRDATGARRSGENREEQGCYDDFAKHGRPDASAKRIAPAALFTDCKEGGKAR